MQIQINIEPVSYRKHYFEQEGTPEDLLKQLKDDLTTAIENAHLVTFGIVDAILNGEDEKVGSLSIRDHYADLPDAPLDYADADRTKE